MADLKIDAERTAFERWAMDYGLNCDYIAGGAGDYYIHEETIAARAAWDASRRSTLAAHTAREAEPVAELLTEMRDAITECINHERNIKDWAAADHWRDILRQFDEWRAAPQPAALLEQAPERTLTRAQIERVAAHCMETGRYLLFMQNIDNALDAQSSQGEQPEGAK